ncbi:hypothetical protein KIPB_001972 [Kipferlia bialata]|uniref:Helicase ATP-binding domain-containing protein n=1 Tax=Kipferlia bialata TaxID=797122 RepID=A0A9K3GGC1_9EUKA|nr:hypothetical protein KIPB_001972 [Kipferlia bialata]|eukprot:g1972.t1
MGDAHESEDAHVPSGPHQKRLKGQKGQKGQKGRGWRGHTPKQRSTHPSASVSFRPLVRGSTAHFTPSPPRVYTLKSYQKELVAKAMSHEGASLVSLPTGTGKTFVAAEWIHRRMERVYQQCDTQTDIPSRPTPSRVAWFLVPTEALAQQQASALRDYYLCTGGYSVCHLQHMGDGPHLESVLAAHDVVVCTAGTLCNILSLPRYRQVCVSLPQCIGVVFDEVHQLRGQSDMALIAEALAAEASPSPVLGLSATPAVSFSADATRVSIQTLTQSLRARVLVCEEGESAEELASVSQSVSITRVYPSCPLMPYEHVHMREGLPALQYLSTLPPLIPESDTGTLVSVVRALRDLRSAVTSLFPQICMSIMQHSVSRVCIGTTNGTQSTDTETGREVGSSVVAASSLLGEGQLLYFCETQVEALLASCCFNALGITSSYIVGKAPRRSFTALSSALGLPPQSTASVLDRLQSGVLRVLCSTPVGREGIDVQSLTRVVLPCQVQHPEHWQQAIGRARQRNSQVYVMVNRDTDNVSLAVQSLTDMSQHILSIGRQGELGHDRDNTNPKSCGSPNSDPAVRIGTKVVELNPRTVSQCVNEMVGKAPGLFPGVTRSKDCVGHAEQSSTQPPLWRVTACICGCEGEGVAPRKAAASNHALVDALVNALDAGCIPREVAHLDMPQGHTEEGEQESAAEAGGPSSPDAFGDGRFDLNDLLTHLPFP